MPGALQPNSSIAPINLCNLPSDSIILVYKMKHQAMKQHYETSFRLGVVASSATMILFAVITSLMAGTTIAINAGGLLMCNKDITVDYMQQCPDEPNMAVSFKDMVIVQINKKQSAFSGKIEFLKTVGEPWKLQFRLRKCKSKDNSKSCQDFFRFEIDKICDKLPQKNQVWSEFLDEMAIDRNCPLQPKVYSVNNIIIDADAMKYFPMSSAYYKMRIEGTMDGTKIICVDSAFTLSCRK